MANKYLKFAQPASHTACICRGGRPYLSPLAQNNQSKRLVIASKNDLTIVVCLIFIITCSVMS